MRLDRACPLPMGFPSSGMSNLVQQRREKGIRVEIVVDRNPMVSLATTWSTMIAKLTATWPR
jgi:hypothetical protein